MALTLRLVKGSELTYQEQDDNYSGLADGSLFSGQQLIVGGSLANQLRIAGGASAVAPSLVAQGTDLNIGIYYATRGTGAHIFAGGPNQWNHFIINASFDTGAGGNQIWVQGATAGNPPIMMVEGGDANASLNVNAKGTGLVTINRLKPLFDAAPWNSFTVGDTTPSVSTGNHFQTSNSGPTVIEITQFDDGTDGQTIVIAIGAFDIIKNNANIVNSSGADITGTATSPLVGYIKHGALWKQCGGGAGSGGTVWAPEVWA
jgi:hypothetical protein